jgi:hypothetical protein
MARTTIQTSLSLDRWAQVMGISLKAFNNLRDDTDQPLQGIRAYWNQVAHDELATYIAQAEAMMREGRARDGLFGLGFDIGSVQRQETIPLDPRRDSWQNDSYVTTRGYVQAFGTWTAALIEAGAEVAYSGDQATVTIADAPEGVQPDEVRVHYRTADGADAAGSDSWRIAQVTVQVDGTTITIRGHKALFVLPAVLEQVEPGNYAEAANFVTAVDVYRVTVDDELPATLVWDAVQQYASADPTADATQQAAARITDADLGRFQVRPATYSSGAHVLAEALYAGCPERVAVAYIAGYPLQDGSRNRLDPELESAVVRLANIVSPDYAHLLNDMAEWKWKNDRQQPTDDNPLRQDEVSNPFGFSRGARFAWDVVRRKRIVGRPF